MTAIRVKNLPEPRGRWIETDQVAELLRRALGAGRNWGTWLREDRRERHEDSAHLRCYLHAGRIHYDSEDVLDLIRRVRNGKCDLSHPERQERARKPSVDAAGDRIVVNFRQRSFSASEARDLVVEMVKAIKKLRSQAVSGEGEAHAGA